MNGGITLWNPRRVVSNDESGATVVKYSFPPAPCPPRYEKATNARPEKLLYVPSLQSLCIRTLADFPEEVHILHPTRLLYKPPQTRQDHDVIRELVHDPASADDETDLSVSFTDRVDPQLWAVLVQVYTHLPIPLRTYVLSLADPHLPLLQQIPWTQHFAMVTIVDLWHCSELTDHTIVRLRELHNLAYLDISNTAITSWGITSLSKTLTRDGQREISDIRHFRGPWMLRILCIRDCARVDDGVFKGLSQFPLLSVIGDSIPKCH